MISILNIPVELRLHIYRLVLPCTIEIEASSTLKSTPSTHNYLDSPGNITRDAASHARLQLHRSNSMTSLMKTFRQPPMHCTLWRRGCTTLLCVNKQIYREAIDILYGENAFSLVISYDSIDCHFAWQLPSGLRPQGHFNIDRWFLNGHIRRLRNIVVTIKHLDGYTAMMKYNCGSAGFAAGLRGQLARLVRFIHRKPGEPQLRSVVVRAVRGSSIRIKKVAETFQEPFVPDRILNPLQRLRGVGVVEISSEDFGPGARALEDLMMSNSVPVDVGSWDEDQPNAVVGVW